MSDDTFRLRERPPETSGADRPVVVHVDLGAKVTRSGDLAKRDEHFSGRDGACPSNDSVAERSDPAGRWA